MTRIYDFVATDPGTGPNKVDVATFPIGGKKAQVVGIDVGDENVSKPLGDEFPMPVKAETLPLPDGAASEATLLTSLTTLAAILSALQDTLDIDGTVDVSSSTLPTGASTEATLAAILAKLQATLAITATALPLPAGAAAEATLAAVNTKLGAALPLPTGAATQTTLAAILTALASVAVTGPLTDTQLRASAIPVSAGALPLPSGAATQATLASVLSALQAAIPAGSNLIGSVVIGANASTTAATLAQAVKTVAAIGTPEALVASSTLVECVQIQACKGFNSANATPVFIGQASGNDANYLRLRPWGVLEVRAAPGKKIDLHQVFIDVLTAGDGVSFLSIN